MSWLLRWVFECCNCARDLLSRYTSQPWSLIQVAVQSAPSDYKRSGFDRHDSIAGRSWSLLAPPLGTGARVLRI